MIADRTQVSLRQAGRACVPDAGQHPEPTHALAPSKPWPWPRNFSHLTSSCSVWGSVLGCWGLDIISLSESFLTPL